MNNYSSSRSCFFRYYFAVWVLDALTGVVMFLLYLSELIIFSWGFLLLRIDVTISSVCFDSQSCFCVEIEYFIFPKKKGCFFLWTSEMYYKKPFNIFFSFILFKIPFFLLFRFHSSFWELQYLDDCLREWVCFVTFGNFLW